MTKGPKSLLLERFKQEKTGSESVALHALKLYMLSDLAIMANIQLTL